MNAEVKQELFNYLGNELDVIVLDTNLFEIEAIIKKWNPISQETPFDGDYLCYIERNNECGTISKYQKVITNKQNSFRVEANEKVLFWQELSENPFH